MLSFALDRSPRLALLFAAVFAVGLSLTSCDTWGQNQSTRPTNPDSFTRNGLRSDTSTYRVPERISIFDEESDQRSIGSGIQEVQNPTQRQPVRQPMRTMRDPQVRTQGSVPARDRRSNIRRTNYQTPYTPQHLRVANAGQPPILGGNAPIRSTVAGRLVGQVEDDVYYESEVGMPVEEIIDGDCCGSCDACMIGDPCPSGFCDRTNTDVCGCGDLYNCPICQECWLNGFGGLICNTEWFLGSHSFDPIDRTGQQGRFPDTNQFGFHGGVNVGLTLKRLTCGMVSGQVGVSIYSSDFNGDGVVTNETREQIFFTTGLFRRVDYGWQFGSVVDILYEDWFYRTEMVQVRSEISYAYGNGSLTGFQFIKGVQDGGMGHALGVLPDLLDTYRFFARTPAFNGQGFADVYAGFSGQKHGIVGASADVNLTRLIAIQAGYTFVWESRTTDEASNIYMRMVLRPASRNWFRNYHRPFFPVADNGSMITIWR